VSFVFRYVRAIGLVLIAFALTWWFKPYITQTPTGFFVLAVLVCSLSQGLGPSLVTAILSVAVEAYVFMEPVYSFRVSSSSDVLQLIVLVVLAFTVSALKESKTRLERVLDSILLFRGTAPRIAMCPVCHNIEGLNGRWRSLIEVAQDSGAPILDTVCPNCAHSVHNLSNHGVAPFPGA
jgi:hypothetical protein